MADKAYSRKRPPEEVAAIKEALNAEYKSLRQVARQYGISNQRIAQIAGPVDRQLGRREHKQQAVVSLFLDGLTDEQIGARLGISVTYVRELRCEAGLRRPHPHKRWSEEKILEAARQFYLTYGYTPAATDWNPSAAKKAGQLERVVRFYQSGAPTVRVVLHYFPSWKEMIRQAGLPPAPHGGAAIGYWKRAGRG